MFYFNIGGSASENPTNSISSLSGEEFTESLVSQVGRINQVMRLMAGGIQVQKPGGGFHPLH
jgi:hypothetical protein